MSNLLQPPILYKAMSQETVYLLRCFQNGDFLYGTLSHNLGGPFQFSNSVIESLANEPRI